MNNMIIKFLKKQTCATICCVDEMGKPYCFSCFYAFNAEEGLIYFKSSAESYHSVLMKKNPFIAGTVLPDKLKTLIVKGVQFEGDVTKTDHLLMKQASAYYHKKHPMALAMSGEIWILQINAIKMTDSTMGFGKKITWSREEKARNYGLTIIEDKNVFNCVYLYFYKKILRLFSIYCTKNYLQDSIIPIISHVSFSTT